MSIESEPLRLPRFSLRTLLLVTVVIAVALAQVILTWRNLALRSENERLSAENEKLRAEAGVLEAKNPREVAVVGVPSLDELTWRWKVYLPAGKWVMNAEHGKIPAEGFEMQHSSRSTLYVSSNGKQQIPVEVGLRKNAAGNWQMVGRTGSIWSRARIDSDHALISGVGYSSINKVAGSQREESFPPDKPVELLRLRASKMQETSPGARSSPPPTMDPADGLLIWFERQ